MKVKLIGVGNDCPNTPIVLDQLPVVIGRNADAKQRISRQSHLAAERICCEYDGARLFLQGQVPSFYHEQLAQEAIAGMAGVVQVVNKIDVLW